MSSSETRESIARVTLLDDIWKLEGESIHKDSSLEPILQFKNVDFSYAREMVLRDVSFDIFSKDFLAIIGPNGGGKSTLMKLMLGLLKPRSGNILYSKNWRHRVGYVPQDTAVNKDFPIQVIDVVKMGLLKPKPFGFRSSLSQDKRVFEILNRLGIAELSKKKIGDLSGGQRQKVLIARALCGHPEVLMLDEPTSNIDTKSQKEIYDLLKFLNNFYSIIVISHDISILLGYASRVLSVNREVVAHDVPKLNISSQGHVCEIDILNQILGVNSNEGV